MGPPPVAIGITIRTARAIDSAKRARPPRRSALGAHELRARVSNVESETLDIALRAASGLRDADGDVAIALAHPGEPRGEKRGLHAATAKLRQRARAEEAADAFVFGDSRAARHFRVDKRKKTCGVGAVGHARKRVEQRFGDGLKLGEAFGDRARPQISFAGGDGPNDDA